jgi:ABC-2 type transport system permease protein
MKFATAFRKEWLELNRTKRLLIAMVVLVLFGMTSPLLAKMLPQIMSLVPGGEQIKTLIPEPTVNDAIAQYVKNITQFGILLALLFGMGSMATEKDKGTAAMVLSKPMPRSTFLLAKLAAQGLLFTLAIVISGAACYYYTILLFGSVDLLSFAEMNGLILVYLFVYVALTHFFSTLTKTQYVAIGLGFGALILFGLISAIPGWGAYTPDLLVTNASKIGIGVTPDQWIGVWVGLGLIVLSLLAAWLIFRKQEI